MKVVIDIPEETVNAIKDKVMFGVIPSEILWDITSAIENGTPLPKNHGRLIDADVLIEFCQNDINKTVDCNDIARFPTIIEADKEKTE